MPMQQDFASETAKSQAQVEQAQTVITAQQKVASAERAVVDKKTKDLRRIESVEAIERLMTEIEQSAEEKSKQVAQMSSQKQEVNTEKPKTPADNPAASTAVPPSNEALVPSSVEVVQPSNGESKPHEDNEQKLLNNTEQPATTSTAVSDQAETTPRKVSNPESPTLISTFPPLLEEPEVTTTPHQELQENLTEENINRVNAEEDSGYIFLEDITNPIKRSKSVGESPSEDEATQEIVSRMEEVAEAASINDHYNGHTLTWSSSNDNASLNLTEVGSTQGRSIGSFQDDDLPEDAEQDTEGPKTPETAYEPTARQRENLGWQDFLRVQQPSRNLSNEDANQRILLVIHIHEYEKTQSAK